MAARTTTTIPGNRSFSFRSDSDNEGPDEEGGTDERGRHRDAHRQASGTSTEVAQRPQREVDGAVEREQQHERDPGEDGVRR